MKLMPGCLFLVCSITTVMAQDFSLFLEKAENLVGSKVQGWKLTDKELKEKEANYQWGSAKAGLRISVFYSHSKEDAAEKLRVSMRRVSVGPDVRLEGLGEEAYLWIGRSSGSGVVQLRKSNFYIHVSASTSKMAEDVARSLAALIL